MKTPPPDKQPAAETLEEIAEQIARNAIPGREREGVRAGMQRALRESVLSALRNERERNCRLLCEWCGNDEYDLIWHHEEWRHYRKKDMYVEYCKAEVLRGRPSGKESRS